MALGPLAGRALGGLILKEVLEEGAAEVGAAEAEPTELSTDVVSEAIKRISWKDDTVTVVFHRGGKITYEYPCDRAQYEEFAAATSKGQYFNQNFRE